MLRSLMSGLTGLQGHQKFLDVVGHNVSNVNTMGYKKSVASFQDLLYQTTKPGSAPGTQLGGINPMQVGHGTIIGSIDTYLTQGDVQFTGNPTNAAIEGAGYFVLRNGNKETYTRAGNFVYDANRNIVQSGTGCTLQGYVMTEDATHPGTFIPGAALADVNVPLGKKLAGKATSTAGYRCNLDSRVKGYLPMGIMAHDATTSATFNVGGAPTKYEIAFREGATVNEFFALEAKNPDGSVNGSLTFQFEGVNSAGLPQLSVSTSAPASGIFAAPATVTYDAASGRLKVENTTPGSEGSWEFNIAGVMDYQVLSVPVVTNPGPPPVSEQRKYLAEFNDVAVDGSREVTLWGPDGATPAAYGAARGIVKMNPDGTFSASNPISAGWALTQLDGADIVGALGTPSFSPSADGKSLELRTNGVSVAGASIAQRPTSVHSAPQPIYDSLGNAHFLNVSWEKVDNNTWRWRSWIMNDDGTPSPITVTSKDGTPATGLLTFDKAGKATGSAEPSIKIGFGAVGSEDAAVTLDFSGKSFGKESMEGVTQFGSMFTTRGYVQDGRAMGVLTEMAYQPDGTLTGIFDNGSSIPLYRIPVALFTNPEGLSKIGENNFVTGPNSGVPQYVLPTESGAGKITGRSVEMSNVDITEEFINLIRGQRGYQANARIVTTSDQVLEETLNLKR